MSRSISSMATSQPKEGSPRKQPSPSHRKPKPQLSYYWKLLKPMPSQRRAQARKQPTLSYSRKQPTLSYSRKPNRKQPSQRRARARNQPSPSHRKPKPQLSYYWKLKAGSWSCGCDGEGSGPQLAASPPAVSPFAFVAVSAAGCRCCRWRRSRHQQRHRQQRNKTQNKGQQERERERETQPEGLPKRTHPKDTQNKQQAPPQDRSAGGETGRGFPAVPKAPSRTPRRKPRQGQSKRGTRNKRGTPSRNTPTSQPKPRRLGNRPWLSGCAKGTQPDAPPDAQPRNQRGWQKMAAKTKQTAASLGQ